jgi:hypothetical protein
VASYKDDKTFVELMQHVLHVEGDYSDDPRDSGGPTKYGLAWNYNTAALKAIGITRGTMNKLTMPQALALYYERYWLASGSDGLTDLGLALIHFDCAVNTGVGQAKKCLRGLSVNPKYFDGTGDNNEILFLRLVHEYELIRLSFYTNKCPKEQRKRYLEGWNNRMIYAGRKAFELV